VSKEAKSADVVGFYAADIGITRELVIGAGASVMLTDADGPLTPGRWVIQLRTALATEYAWIRVGAFKKGSAIAATIGPGRDRFPLSPSALIAIEFNVRKGENDRIAGITEFGAATLYISRVSADA
jgi:hypothetical protein